MKRLALLALSLTLVVAPIALLAPAPAPIVVRMVSYTVQGPEADLVVMATRSSRLALRISKDRAGGTGVPIARVAGKTLVLTAKHVVEHLDPTFNVQTWDGRAFMRCSAITLHPTEDLAIFWIDGAVDIVPIGPGYLMGQQVYSSGYGLMEGLSITTGIIGDKAFGLPLMSAPVIFGMSGGPVVDAAGRLIGINKEVTTGPHGPLPLMSMFQPVVPFLDWIGENLTATLPR